MTAEPFSIIRRAPGLVDIIFPRQADVAGYRLLASPDLDGTPTAFTVLFTAHLHAGYLDPAVNRFGLTPVSDRVGVRASFNPDTFTAAGISDTSQFWLRFRPVDSAGIEGADSAPVHVITPEQHRGTARVAFNSTAPAAATLAGSLEVKLGCRAKDIVIQNNSAATVMFFAFYRGGGEIKIPAGGSYSSLRCAQPTILVRGSGGTADYSVSYTTLNTPV